MPTESSESLESSSSESSSSCSSSSSSESESGSDDGRKVGGSLWYICENDATAASAAAKLGPMVTAADVVACNAGRGGFPKSLSARAKMSPLTPLRLPGRYSEADAAAKGFTVIVEEPLPEPEQEPELKQKEQPPAPPVASPGNVPLQPSLLPSPRLPSPRLPATTALTSESESETARSMKPATATATATADGN